MTATEVPTATAGEIVSPITGEVIGTAPWSTPEEVDDAVEAARRSFSAGTWSQRPAVRAVALRAWADLIEAEADSLIDLLVVETAKLRGEAAFEVASGVASLRYNAGMAQHVDGRAGVLGDGSTAHLERTPVGPTAFIAPWNFPVFLLLRDLSPGLAAGVTAVIKPADRTPLSTLLLAELAQRAGVPEGVVNVVVGGAEVGSALIDHPAIRAVAFTGSTGVGRAILGSSAGQLKKVLLELGGKGCSLVLADGPIDKAVARLTQTALMAAGQVCMSTSRVLVQAQVYDQVLEQMKAAFAAVKVGSPLDAASQMGPVFSAADRERVLSYVATARDEGECWGGEAVDLDDRGAYVSPAIATGLGPESRVVQDEVFGPLVTVERFDTVEEGLALANGTRFGLTAGIWTADVGVAWDAARALEFGSVWVNGYGTSYPEMPSGGFKQSGLGRTRGIEGINEFTELKHINWPAPGL